MTIRLKASLKNQRVATLTAEIILAPANLKIHNAEFEEFY